MEGLGFESPRGKRFLSPPLCRTEPTAQCVPMFSRLYTGKIGRGVSFITLFLPLLSSKMTGVLPLVPLYALMSRMERTTSSVWSFKEGLYLLVQWDR